MKRKGQKEDIVLSQCLEYLRLNRIYCWRNNVGCAKIGNRFMHFGLKGSSDILGILPNGRFLAVECKRENGGRLSENQKEFLKKIEENNGIAICVTSVYELERQLFIRLKKS